VNIKGSNIVSYIFSSTSSDVEEAKIIISTLTLLVGVSSK